MYDLYRSPGPIRYFTGPSSVELCIALTLELNKGVDVRMSLQDLEVAKSQQAKSTRYGSYMLSPVTGKATAILSNAQKSRTSFRPTLCTPLSKGAGTHVYEEKQGTQCHQYDEEYLRSYLAIIY
jgi:hypothetical protein